MVKNYNDEDLRDLGVKEEYFLFCQVWKELTDDRTFDSYQFKSFNVINGISELIHNIGNFLEGFVETTHSIESVSAELKKAVGRDNVLKMSFSNIRNLILESLGKKYEKTTELKGLRYQLELYKEELADKYDDALVDVLVDAVDSNNISSTIALTASFISRCIDHGWSNKALCNKLDLKNGKEIKEFLKKILNSSEQKYSILFPFRQLAVKPPKGKTKEESKAYVKNQLNKFGISVLGKDEIIQNNTQINTQLIKEEEYIVVPSKGTDMYSASHGAIISLSNVLNILSFFSVVEPWSVKNKTWIGYNTEAPFSLSLKPLDIYRTYEYLDSSSTIYNRIERLIHDEEQQELYQKLVSAFSYTNLSQVSMSVEEKYMNMWIALESLSRTDAAGGIISNINQCIPSACCLRYVYREVRNFAEDCGRCNVSLDFGSIKIDMQESNKEVIVCQLMQVFRDETLLQRLSERCSVCSLLQYRVQELYKIITDEMSLISHVQSHHQTIKWHLDRLYRIRNEIAHSALFQNVSTVRYTEHLYDYLAIYISELARFAANKNNTKFGVLAAAINENYKEFDLIATDKKIKNKKAYLGSFWSSGIMNFV